MATGRNTSCMASKSRAMWRLSLGATASSRGCRNGAARRAGITRASRTLGKITLPRPGDAAGSTLFFVASVVMMFVALLSGMEHLTHLRAHAPEKDDEELNDREASAK